MQHLKYLEEGKFQIHFIMQTLLCEAIFMIFMIIITAATIITTTTMIITTIIILLIIILIIETLLCKP